MPSLVAHCLWLALGSTHALIVPSIKLPSGDLMPQLGFGTWLAPAGQVYESIKVAIGLGYRHIDEAWIYGNELEAGRAIAEMISSGTVKREELWITSKLWNNFHRPELVRPACEESMAKLGLDYLDVRLHVHPIPLPLASRLARTLRKIIIR